MFDIMPFFGVGITIIVVAFSFFFMFRVFSGLAKGTAERDRLMRVGWPARARIINVQMGGMTVTVGVDRQLQVIIQSEVHVEGRPPFPAQITALVSELQIPQVQPGAWLAVRVDPVNPANIALESTRVGPPGSPGPVMGPVGFGNSPMGAAQGAAWGGPDAGGFGGQGNLGGYAPGPYAGAQGGFGAGQWGAGAPMPGMGMAGGHGTPVRGFRMPLGAKIGLAIGLIGAVVGIGVAVMAVGWTSGIGGPSEACEKAAKCCRKISGSNNTSCENYLKQSGPIADKVCEESLKSFRQTKSCK